jgi:hypothetical protein
MKGRWGGLGRLEVGVEKASEFEVRLGGIENLKEGGNEG